MRNKLFNLKNIASIRSPSLNQTRGGSTKSSKSDSPHAGPSGSSSNGTSNGTSEGSAEKSDDKNTMTAMIKEKFDQIYRATPVPTAILNEGGMPMPMPLSAPVPGYRHNASNMAYPILRAYPHVGSSNGSVNSNYSGNSHNSHGSSNGGSMSSGNRNYQPLNRNSPRNNNNADSTRFPMPMGSPGDYWKERERLILRGKSHSAPRPTNPHRSSTSPGIADSATSSHPKGRGHTLDLDDRMEEAPSHVHSSSHSRSASTTPGSVSSASTSQHRSRSTSRGRGQMTGGDSLMFLDSLPKATDKVNETPNRKINTSTGVRKSTKRRRLSDSKKNRNEVGRSGRMRKKVNYNESELVAAAITDAQLEADGETEGEMDISMENGDITRSGRRVMKPVTQTDLPKEGAQLLQKTKETSHVLLGDASNGENVDTTEITQEAMHSAAAAAAAVEQSKPKYNYTIIPVKEMHTYKSNLGNGDAEAAAWLKGSRKGSTARKGGRGRPRKRLQFNPDADDSDEDNNNDSGEDEEDEKYTTRRHGKKTSASKGGRPRKAADKSTASADSTNTAVNWAPMEVIALYAAHKHASSVGTKNEAAFWKLVSENMASRGITRSAADCLAKWLSCAEEAENRRKKMQKNNLNTNADANATNTSTTKKAADKTTSIALSNDDKDDSEVNDTGTPVKRTPTKEKGNEGPRTRSSPRLKTKV